VTDIRWERYPLVHVYEHAKKWIEEVELIGRDPDTVDTYGRALHDYLRFCVNQRIDPYTAKKFHILAYVNNMKQRPNPKGAKVLHLHSGTGLALATMRKMLTAVRLFYDYLIEEGIYTINPVGRGKYSRGNSGETKKGLLPNYKKLPWIPTEEQWEAIIQVVKKESIRNRAMFAMQYDGAFRREELVSLEIPDLDPAHRTVSIRAETTKNRKGRIVVYQEATSELHVAYMRHRAFRFGRKRGVLFLSESRRNFGEPLSIWSWSKIIEGIAKKVGLEHKFTTHTMRHLRLTDLARAGWDIHEIANFAGHQFHETTQNYIHLSGRDIAGKLAKTMQKIHEHRIEELGKNLYD